MDATLYTAYLGMRARQRALDANANNIANHSTAGYKAERVRYSTAEAELRAAAAAAGDAAQLPADPSSEKLRSQAVLAGGATDFGTGAQRQTGRQLDAAIDGEGFFVVQTPRGVRYARAGNFTLDASGQLVTQGGNLVVGEGGPITIPAGEVSIGDDGTISVAGRRIDRLRIVRFDAPAAALSKDGESLFVATGAEQPTEATGARIVQGALETSNVNTVAELVAMMQNGREFDALQKSISLVREMGRRAASEIGKI